MALEVGTYQLKRSSRIEKPRFAREKKIESTTILWGLHLWKATRACFKIATHQTKQILDYIHLHLCGFVWIISHDGARYFLSIIDDYWRKVWLYILKNKSDTFVKFKEWKTLVENQVGRKVKRLRINNGLE